MKQENRSLWPRGFSIYPSGTSFGFRIEFCSIYAYKSAYMKKPTNPAPKCWKSRIFIGWKQPVITQSLRHAYCQLVHEGTNNIRCTIKNSSREERSKWACWNQQQSVGLPGFSFLRTRFRSKYVWAPRKDLRRDTPSAASPLRIFDVQEQRMCIVRFG